MEINQTKGKEGIEFIQNELGLTSDKSVINLLKGTYPISEKHYPKIAAMGNCSIAYLKGESNARNKKELNENIKKLEEEVSKLYKDFNTSLKTLENRLKNIDSSFQVIDKVV